MDPPAALVVAPPVGADTDPGRSDVIAGHWVVRFDRAMAVDELAGWALDQGVAVQVPRLLGRDAGAALPGPLHNTWTLQGEVDLPERLAGVAGVSWVEPLIAMRAATAPNDPYYGFQWNLSSLGVPDTWDTSRGRGVVIAVLDTGVSAGPDGLALLLDGYDFVDGDPDPSDSGWHGTHVAGVIAQVTDNGEGVASVAPGAAILPVRVLAESGGTSVELAEGITWAVDQGADVLNLSLGSASESQLVSDALAYAEAQEVVVVAASGNDGQSDFVQFPASVGTVLGVGATLLDGAIAAYSNGGPELDLVAPAGTIGADTDGDGLPDAVLQEAWIDGQWQYVVAEGTSLATPHVAGAAALLLGAADLSPAQVRDALTASAIDLGDAGPDHTFGAGLLDPMAALSMVASPGSGTASDDDGSDDDGVSAGGGAGIRPTSGDSVSLGTDEGGTLGCGG